MRGFDALLFRAANILILGVVECFVDRYIYRCGMFNLYFIKETQLLLLPNYMGAYLISDKQHKIDRHYSKFSENPFRSLPSQVGNLDRPERSQ